MTGHALYAGVVTHTRTHVVRHTFAYRVYMHLFEVGELGHVNGHFRLLGYNRRRPVGLHDADHFDGRPIAEALRREVERAGRRWPGGRVLMLANARVFGYVFNPISVYYCFDPNDQLETVVAEVHNTFGERHVYVLHPQQSRTSTRKVFHVSPFFSLEGTYTFTLPEPGEHLDIAIDLEVGGEQRMAARLHLERRLLTDTSLARMLLRYPLMTLQVMGAIHLEALRLWWKGLRYRPKPAHAPESARRTTP